jgi:hypothetical protein
LPPRAPLEQPLDKKNPSPKEHVAMNQFGKTAVFVVAAAALVVAAWLTGPSTPAEESGALLGQRLVEKEFKPLDAASLEIVKFDEDTAALDPFQVAQIKTKDGKWLWSIPSHDDYPADAQDQVAQAASSLMGLEILEVVTDSPSEHATYGVIDPDPKTLKVGTTGVGTRVTMRDRAGKQLVSLVIGKAVPDREGLHYVRRAGDDHVYVVDVKTDKLSTKFADWIEKDLLKLSPWDIKRLDIHDYSIVPVDLFRVGLDQRGEMTLEYNDTGDPKWKLAKDEQFIPDEQRWVPRQLAADEELDTTKLDDLKYALDDLKIVDVRRKPEGLSADLKATGNFAKDEAALESMAMRGFYPVPQSNDQIEVFSSEGEVRCLMKDGVEYILRFGEMAGTASEAAKRDGKDAAAKDAEKKGDAGKDDPEAKGDSEKPKAAGVDRFLLVTAQFNPDAIPAPELEPLPEEKPAETAPPAGQQKSPAAEKAPAAESDTAAPEKAPEAAPGDAPAADATKADDPAKADDAAKAADPAETKADAGQPKQDEAKQADPAAAEGSAAETDKKDDTADVAKERERIQKENQRKQDDYQEQIKKGKEHAKELNARFADWYYVISDDVYQKIHLGRDQIVKVKEKKETTEGSGTGDQGTTGEGATDNAAAGAQDSQAPKATETPVGEFKRLKGEGPDGKAD